MRTFSRSRLAATVSAIALSSLMACSSMESSVSQPHGAMATYTQPTGKPVVYQVFTRLFGNTNAANIPWGTKEQNGVGKFSDFTPTALAAIKSMGVNYVWYTGVPHHDLVGDYTAYGISNDDPDVVKGRAGSPYAVKDYYNVDPDLANDPAKRLAEFEQLIDRTHAAGMGVIIDIVPNHVARNYHSISRPEGIEDFGAQDDTSVTYAKDNNFYYVPGQDFQVPEPKNGYQVLGGEAHPLADGQFDEKPAKWTGNGSRKAQPDFYDWYETVKVNYGVRPDGSHDFPSLPAGFDTLDYRAHAAFWADKDVPDSWKKFRDIALYWLAKGVDGFRYDMAEMVPVEFWSYMNSSIKMVNPDAFLLAEVYNPKMYRDYIRLGKMDYLYDKVEFYDTLKAIMQGKGDTAELANIQSRMADIESHMLHFLENHDEQRIASPDFAGDANKGKPAMVVSALISRSPTMLYFGQAEGEDGSEAPGFGGPTRTSIFDYVGVPAHQAWMNHGKFDGGLLTPEQKALHSYYQTLLNFSATNPAMQGEYQSLHQVNLDAQKGYHSPLFAFARWQGDDQVVVVSNFSADKSAQLPISLGAALTQRWGVDQNSRFTDALTGQQYQVSVQNGSASIAVSLPALGSVVLVKESH